MNEKKRKGANEKSSPFNLRLPHKTRDKLDAVAAQLPILSTHRVAGAALDIGLAALAADPSLILRIGAPAKAVEAAPAPAETLVARRPSVPPPRASSPPARASVRPPLPSVPPPPPRVPAELVETEAARVDPRQLALIAEPPADLDGMTVRVMPLETVAEVRARIAALQAANPKLSNRKIGSLAGLSNAPVDKIMRGGNVRPETLARIAAILPPE